jgi:hypothetical protein
MKHPGSDMKAPLILPIVVLSCAFVGHASAMPANSSLDASGGFVHLAGNTSSNSSSNTSSNSSAGGSSYIHKHKWSVDSDDNNRRSSSRGVTRIERYVPERPRYRYRDRRDDDDD